MVFRVLLSYECGQLKSSLNVRLPSTLHLIGKAGNQIIFFLDADPSQLWDDVVPQHHVIGQLSQVALALVALGVPSLGFLGKRLGTRIIMRDRSLFSYTEGLTS